MERESDASRVSQCTVMFVCFCMYIIVRYIERYMEGERESKREKEKGY